MKAFWIKPKVTRVEKKPRVFLIRDSEKLDVLAHLWDEDNKKKNKAARRALWVAIAGILPEVMMGKWELNFGNPFEIVITEQL